MNNKNIHLKTTLFIALLGFHTFASCTSTQQALGAQNRRHETSWCSRPSWLTWGNFNRSFNTYKSRYLCGGFVAISTLAVLSSTAIYYSLSSMVPAYNGLCGGYNSTVMPQPGLSDKSGTSTEMSTQIDEIRKTVKDSINNYVSKYGTKPCTIEEISEFIDNEYLNISSFDQWITENITKDNINDIKDSYGRTALMLALRFPGSNKTVKFLLERGANPNEKDQEGHTSLMYASSPDNIELLVSKGAKVDEVDNDGNTALMRAVIDRNKINRNKEIVASLIEQGTDLNRKNINSENFLLTSVRYNYPDFVKLALNKNVDVNAVNSVGDTALHIAAYNGYTKIVEQLVGRDDIDVNKKGNNGNTAIYLAVSANRVEAVEILLKHKDIQLDIKNNNDQIAIHTGAYQCSADSIEKLLQIKGEDSYPRQKNDVLQTPLDIAKQAQKNANKEKEKECNDTVNYLEAYLNRNDTEGKNTNAGDGNSANEDSQKNPNEESVGKRRKRDRVLYAGF